MALEMNLWRVEGSALRELGASRLDEERRLEDWIVADPAVLGMRLAVVGRQVVTPFGGRIDVLALDQESNCVVLELKRDRTPREIVAQLLDYASWVNGLGYADLDKIAQQSRQKSLKTVFEDTFGSTMSATVNAGHNLILVASELDDSSERIINYLVEEHGVSINAVFFRFFRDGASELLGRAWLRDPEQTIERAESRKSTPWAGQWFVNVGEGPHRNWDDNREYGFLSAGGGEQYSGPLRKLSVGDNIYAYMKGLGYVGFGEVTKAAVPISDFTVDGKPLLDLTLRAPMVNEHGNSPTMGEWVVGVNWLKAYPREQAQTFKGVFANQNIVCKLRDQRTLEFLRSAFASA